MKRKTFKNKNIPEFAVRYCWQICKIGHVLRIAFFFLLFFSFLFPSTSFVKIRIVSKNDNNGHSKRWSLILSYKSHVYYKMAAWQVSFDIQTTFLSDLELGLVYHLVALLDNTYCSHQLTPFLSQTPKVHIHKLHNKLDQIQLKTWSKWVLYQNSVNLWRARLLLYTAYFAALYALGSWLAVNRICYCWGDFYEWICTVRDTSSASQETHSSKVYRIWL